MYAVRKEGGSFSQIIFHAVNDILNFVYQQLFAVSFVLSFNLCFVLLLPSFVSKVS